MSPLVCANTLTSLHIANLRQLTLRGPDLRTGHVHKLQLKQRLTSQLHHFAELSYNSSPTSWLASTNSSTQLNVQPNFAITQANLDTATQHIHHSSSASHHNIFAAETASLLTQLKQHKILFYLSTYRNSYHFQFD